MTEIPCLTADDVKAIRQATAYSVDCNSPAGTILRCYKKTRAKHADAIFQPLDGPIETEARRDIVIAPFNEHGTRAHFYQSYRDGAWQAFGLIIRAGDRLHLAARENGNGYLRAAEAPHGKQADGYSGGSFDQLYKDELTATLYRGDHASHRARTIVSEFVLCDSITPQNTARAIRPKEYALRTA